MRNPLLCVLALLSLLGPAWAQAPAPPKGPAWDALGKVAAAYADLKSVQVDMNVTILAEEFAGTGTTTMLVSRPRKLSWHGHYAPQKESVPFDVYVVCDASNYYVFSTKFPKEYTLEKLPEWARVMDLGDHVNVGPDYVILRAMKGEPQAIVAGRKLEVRQADAMTVFSMTDGEGAGADVEELYVDPATQRIMRVVNLVDGKKMAECTITYSHVGEEFGAEKFEIKPAEGAQPKPSTPEKP